MFVIVGWVVVLIAVFGGFGLEGGHFAALFQPIELLIIGGAALGTLITSSPPSLLKEMVRQIVEALKGKETSKTEYTELLLLLFELVKTAKQNLLGLEAHVENPDSSAIFTKYPTVLKNHHAIHFICDTLKVQISSPVSPYDLDDLMSTDLEATHSEELKAPTTLNRTSDAMPGLGIVAAVMGVVITMGKLSQGKEVIGHSVGAALVGTFIGILLCYGILQPLAAKMELNLGMHGKYMEVIKAGLLAFAKNCSPKVCVEFARRTIPPEVRPDFAEVDQATSQLKGAA